MDQLMCMNMTATPRPSLTTVHLTAMNLTTAAMIPQHTRATVIVHHLIVIHTALVRPQVDHINQIHRTGHPVAVIIHQQTTILPVTPTRQHNPPLTPIPHLLPMHQLPLTPLCPPMPQLMPHHLHMLQHHMSHLLPMPLLLLIPQSPPTPHHPPMPQHPLMHLLPRMHRFPMDPHHPMGPTCLLHPSIVHQVVTTPLHLPTVHLEVATHPCLMAQVTAMPLRPPIVQEAILQPRPIPQATAMHQRHLMVLLATVMPPLHRMAPPTAMMQPRPMGPPVMSRPHLMAALAAMFLPTVRQAAVTSLHLAMTPPTHMYRHHLMGRLICMSPHHPTAHPIVCPLFQPTLLRLKPQTVQRTSMTTH